MIVGGQLAARRQPPQDLETRQAGQPHVEQDDVGAAAGNRGQRLLAVGSASPTTAIPRSKPRRLWMPSRTRAWSSTRKTRITPTAPQRQDGRDAEAAARRRVDGERAAALFAPLPHSREPVAGLDAGGAAAVVAAVDLDRPVAPRTSSQRFSARAWLMAFVTISCAQRRTTSPACGSSTVRPGSRST